MGHGEYLGLDRGASRLSKRMKVWFFIPSLIEIDLACSVGCQECEIYASKQMGVSYLWILLNTSEGQSGLISSKPEIAMPIMKLMVRNPSMDAENHGQGYWKDNFGHYLIWLFSSKDNLIQKIDDHIRTKEVGLKRLAHIARMPLMDLSEKVPGDVTINTNSKSLKCG